jgi:hypothetical protein
MQTFQQTSVAFVSRTDTREIAEALIREHQERISSRHQLLIMYGQNKNSGTTVARVVPTRKKSDSFISRQLTKLEHFYELL